MCIGTVKPCLSLQRLLQAFLLYDAPFSEHVRFQHKPIFLFMFNDAVHFRNMKTERNTIFGNSESSSKALIQSRSVTKTMSNNCRWLYLKIFGTVFITPERKTKAIGKRQYKYICRPLQSFERVRLQPSKSTMLFKIQAQAARQQLKQPRMTHSCSSPSWMVQNLINYSSLGATAPWHRVSQAAGPCVPRPLLPLGP